MVRKANDVELADLDDYYKRVLDVELAYEDWERWVAVFEDYISDSPGYAGKLMMVVWGGGPELYEMFKYEDGVLKAVEQDETMKKPKKFKVVWEERKEVEVWAKDEVEAEDKVWDCEHDEGQVSAEITESPNAFEI